MSDVNLDTAVEDHRRQSKARRRLQGRSGAQVVRRKQSSCRRGNTIPGIFVL